MRRYEKILEMKEKIKKTRTRGQIPLFIVGAGVSSPVGIWTMRRILKNLAESLEGRGFFDLAQEAKRIEEDPFYQSRAAASKLFGTLQEHKKYESAWEDFTKKFLDEGGIWLKEPTRLHQDIAKQVVEQVPPALCISLNYDGLTAKAIKKAALRGDKEEKTTTFYPCRILTSSEEIEEYFVRDGDAWSSYPIIKLRGDIFNAVCRRDDCPLGGKPVPIYLIGKEKQKHRKLALAQGSKEQIKERGDAQKPKMVLQEQQGLLFEKDSYKEVIKCPECNKERRIELDFPGARVKEFEAEKIVKALVQYILPTIGCVIVLGVSGSWDPEVVEFLKVCAIDRDIKIYYLSNSNLLRKYCYWATDAVFEYIHVKDFKDWGEQPLSLADC